MDKLRRYNWLSPLQLFELNNGWRRYWVINEKGQKEEISKAHIRAIFEFDIQQLREEKIKEILKKDNE